MRAQAEGPALDLEDAKLDWHEAMAAVLGVVVRFASLEPDAWRDRLAAALCRLGSALRTSPPRGPADKMDSMRQWLSEENFAAVLTTALVHTGQLRIRVQRSDLAGCCLAMAALLSDPAVPDELWERWLDRRDLEPDERIRQLAQLSPRFVEFEAAGQ